MSVSRSDILNDPVLRELRQRLREAYSGRLEKVVLFGSRARGGEATGESDYDVALFLRGYDGGCEDRDRLRALVAPMLSVQTLPFAAGAHRERTPLMFAIREDGIDLESGVRAFAQLPRERAAMQPETRVYLESAERSLTEARGILKAGFDAIAAREAYMAVLESARAYVFEKTRKISKTHSGTNTLFLELVRDQAEFEAAEKAMVGDLLEIKLDVDYGHRSKVGRADVRQIIAHAERFVAKIARLLRPDNE